MKSLIKSIISAAGIASALGIASLANAQNATSLLNLQVSKDGISWADSVDVNPNIESGRVLVRALITWTSTRTDAPVGFASLTWQPVIANPRPQDTVVPFANQGNNKNGGGIDTDASPLDGPFGRIRPFAGTGPSGLQSYIAHFHTGGSGGAPQGNYYRIARNDVTNWTGVGPTTTTAAANNFNGAGGLACVQKPSGSVVPNVDPPFRIGHQDILIFQFAMDFATLAPGEMRNILVTAPLEGMSRNTTTGARRATWFTSGTDNIGSEEANVVVDDAVINLVPTPAALSLLGAAGIVGSGRRRHRDEVRRSRHE